MPKLFFRYGAMSSGKSTQLLVVAHQYFKTGKRAFVIKPVQDTRDGALVSCRIPNMGREVDLLVNANEAVPIQHLYEYDVILVDEVQFLTPEQVEQLSLLSLQVPVICYGLRADYRGVLFPAIQKLMALADEITEVKNICKFCRRKATQNLKLKHTELSRPDESAPASIEIGGDEMYCGVCRRCWYDHRVLEQQKPNNETFSLLPASSSLLFFDGNNK